MTKLKRYNRRQRKKLHLGEFRQIGFNISAKFKSGNDDAEFKRIYAEFIDHAIEKNGLLLMGCWEGETCECWAWPSGKSQIATEAQRRAVRDWLHSQPYFSEIEVGTLTDLNQELPKFLQS